MGCCGKRQHLAVVRLLGGCESQICSGNQFWNLHPRPKSDYFKLSLSDLFFLQSSFPVSSWPAMWHLKIPFQGMKWPFRETQKLLEEYPTLLLKSTSTKSHLSSWSCSFRKVVSRPCLIQHIFSARGFYKMLVVLFPPPIWPVPLWFLCRNGKLV